MCPVSNIDLGLPWSSRAKVPYVVDASDGWRVATFATCGTIETDSARAEFAARSANSHADLLAACEAALDSEPCSFDHHGNCQTHRLGNPCEQKLIREAIAKAKGATDALPQEYTDSHGSNATR